MQDQTSNTNLAIPAPEPDPDDLAAEQAFAQREEEEARMIEEEEFSAPVVDSTRVSMDDEEADAYSIRDKKKKAIRRKRKGGELPRFPKPFTSHFRDDIEDPRGKPQRFFDYWQSLYSRAEYRDRVIVYVYRIWPVMASGRRQMGKMSQPIEYDDLLKLYGCGDYHLKMNDAGYGNVTVAVCTVYNIGNRDLTSHPPIVELDGVDLNDPLNKSYIAWCRSHGIRLPGDPGYESEKEGEEEMATVEAVKELTGTVNRITDKVIDSAEQKVKLLEEMVKSKKPDDGGDVVSKTLDIVKVATASASSIVEKGVAQALALRPENVPVKDPTETMKEAMNLVKELMPKSTESEKIVQMIMDRDKQYVDKVFQIQQERLQSMEKMLEQFMARNINPVPAPAAVTAVQPGDAPLKRGLSALEELVEMKDKLRDILGLDEKPQQEKGWAEYIPQIVQGISLLGTVVATAMYNMAVAKTGQGTPVAPMSAGAAGPVPQTAFPTQTPPPPAEPAQGTMGADTMTRFTQFLSMIERPLLRSFQDGESGADFADKLIELTDAGMFGQQAQGRQVYDAVLEYGEQLVGTLIKTYPPIWSVVSQTPQKWERFLHEFFTADQIWAAEESAAMTDAGAANGGVSTESESPKRKRKLSV